MRRAIRDNSIRHSGEQLPDGVGGTITGGPMQAIDLMEVLNRSPFGVSRGGAVSGAAHVVVSGAGARGAPENDIALSDGSRIMFASVGDLQLPWGDSASVSRTAGLRAPAAHAKQDSRLVPV
jgi:hypothetical protein